MFGSRLCCYVEQLTGALALSRHRTTSLGRPVRVEALGNLKEEEEILLWGRDIRTGWKWPSAKGEMIDLL